MDKVKVEICCGTACYLLGAMSLLELEHQLAPELKSRVEIVPKSCLGLCNDDSLGGAPYVRFNDDEVLSNATVETVLSKIRNMLGVEEA